MLETPSLNLIKFNSLNFNIKVVICKKKKDNYNEYFKLLTTK